MEEEKKSLGKESKNMEKQNKIWTEGNNLIKVKLVKTITDKDVWFLLENLKKELIKSSEKTNILINISTTTVIRSSLFRKKTAEKIKKIIKDPNFNKAAIYGGNIVMKTIASFILKAVNSKKLKMFNNEKKALDWLKINN